MAGQDPTAIQENAEGGFKEKYITQTNSVHAPIIEHLSADEQLQYLFYHHSKGFRIFEPDGSERTPDHETGAWGKRFLLVTDRRIIYIVGKEGGDDVETFGYDELTDVDANHGWTSGRLNFTTTDGVEYKFADNGGLATDIEDAGEYVRERIERARDEAADRQRDPTTAKAEPTAEATGSIEPEGTTVATDRQPTPDERASGSVGGSETAPSRDVSRETIVSDPDELEALAEGNVDGEELTSTGGKIFTVGYFSQRVISHLIGDETIHHVLRNFVDGVERNGTSHEPADNRRAVACVTDRRLLFVLGGTDEAGDETIAVPLDRILRVTADDDALVVVAISPEETIDEYRFPVKNTGELSPAVEYIANRSGSSVLEDHVQRIEQAVADAEESLEANAYDDALDDVDRAFEAHEQYRNIADAVASVRGETTDLTSVSGITGSKADVLQAAGITTIDDLREYTRDELADIDGIGQALAARIKADIDGLEVGDSRPAHDEGSAATIPTPSVSRDELEALADRIRSAKWTDAYEARVETAKEHRSEGESAADIDTTIAAHERAIEAYQEAREISQSKGIGDPDAIDAVIAESREAIHGAHAERAEAATEEAETNRESGDIEAAVTAYERAIKAYRNAREVATEHDVGDPSFIQDQLSSIQAKRDDLAVSSLGRRVSEIEIPESPEDPGAMQDEYDEAIERLDALLEQLDDADVDRTEDLDLIRMEAQRKLVAAQFQRGRARAREAIELFESERYLKAREAFNDISEQLTSIRDSTSPEALGEHADELDHLIELCDRNANIARKQSIGLTSDEEIQRLDPDSGAGSEPGKTPEQLQYDEEEMDGERASNIGTGGDEAVVDLGSELSHEDIETGEQIGSGGNADVYRATIDVDGTRRTIALKEPRMQGTVDKSVIEQFVSEAETWAKLDDHEHIVSVLGYGSAPLPWIALEYMDEGDLADHDELRFAERLEVAIRITDAVWYAHQHGIAHLDLKPANILFTSTGSGAGSGLTPKIADWGLARMLLDHSKSVEALSPRYSAPEQFDSETHGTPDNQTDLYQLGVIIYELLAGEHPFEGSTSQVMHSIMHETPEPPSTHAREISAELDEILLTALSTEKADRQEAVVYLRDGLQSVAGGDQ
jgi:tetratricopeptide (TPR) repeat protein/tRNA A-37 threonylcarbamoyl transferase component Bud32